MTRRNGDPFGNNHFRVEIDGAPALDFSEVTLPEAYVDIVEYREGAAPTPHKLPGAMHLTNLVLRRGVSDSRDLFLWWSNIASGQPDRRNLAVILLDEQRQDVKRWVIHNAFPVRYSVAPLIGGSHGESLVETLECAVEGFDTAGS
jgi:phage tail-like protein